MQLELNRVMKVGNGCINSWWVSDDSYERFTRKSSLMLRPITIMDGLGHHSLIRSQKERDARTGGRYCMGGKIRNF